MLGEVIDRGGAGASPVVAQEVGCDAEEIAPRLYFAVTGRVSASSDRGLGGGAMRLLG